MNFKLRLLALLLLAMMVLSSCSLDAILQYIPGVSTTPTTTSTTTWPSIVRPSRTTTTTAAKEEPTEPKWNREDHSTKKSELEAKYTLTKEEVDATLALLDQMLEGALPDPEGDQTVGKMTIDEVDALYVQFEDAFYHTAQQMTLAMLVYYCNTEDEVAKERYLDTQSMFYEIQDKYTETCRDMYLESPYSAEFFEGWSEEEIQSLLDFDPTTTALKKEIEELQTQVDNLDDNDHNYKDDSTALYVQIITKNNQLAKLYGYDNYYDYASERVYGRDYTAEDLKQFKNYIIEYIVPTYSNVYGGWSKYYDMPDSRKNTVYTFIDEQFDSSNQKKNYLINYLDSLGDTNMGVAMRDVFDSKNCIFSLNANSHPTAFQTYLYEDETPFCLFGKKGQSASTMVHEIGHYYAAYTNEDLNNYDLCETHSQGNEFLFLQYCKGELSKSVYEVVRYYNLYNAYYVMVCATIIDDFEQRVYSLDSVENFTSADFEAIMDEVLSDYGHDANWFAKNLTDMQMYWRRVAISNPVYYISYAISAVAAVEIFAIAESEEEGEGYEAAQAIYTTLVEGVTEEDGFLGALKKAGLYTPFEEEAHKKVAITMNK